MRCLSGHGTVQSRLPAGQERHAQLQRREAGYHPPNDQRCHGGNRADPHVCYLQVHTLLQLGVCVFLRGMYPYQPGGDCLYQHAPHLVMMMEPQDRKAAIDLLIRREDNIGDLGILQVPKRFGIALPFFLVPIVDFLSAVFHGCVAMPPPMGVTYSCILLIHGLCDDMLWRLTSASRTHHIFVANGRGVQTERIPDILVMMFKVNSTRV